MNQGQKLTFKKLTVQQRIDLMVYSQIMMNEGRMAQDWEIGKAISQSGSACIRRL